MSQLADIPHEAAPQNLPRTPSVRDVGVGANAAEQLKTVYVAIKSPSWNQDARMACRLDDNVAALKSQIHTEFPLRPLPEDQRLVYSGKLLHDDLVLSEVFKKSDLSEDQIIHLVIKGSPQQPTELRRRPPPVETSRPSSPLVSSEPQNVSVASSNQLSTQPAIQSIQSNQQYVFMTINGLPYLVPTASLAYMYPPVMQPINQSVQPIPQPVAETPAQPIQPEPQPLPPPVEPDIPLDDELAAALGHRPNPWWLMFRLAFLVYIFSQNASYERIIMLHILAVFIWLWQTGRLQMPRGPGAANRPLAEQRVQMDQVPVPRSTLREALSMVWSFVFSLIPQAE